MQVKVVHTSSNNIKLVLPVHNVELENCPVVLRLVGYDRSDLFKVEDVRLATKWSPNKYFAVGEKGYQASRAYTSEAEKEEILQFIQHPNEPATPRGPTEPSKIFWCTFDGIVRGKTPSELGHGGSVPEIAVYHTEAEAHMILLNTRLFWEDVRVWEDSDISTVSNLKLPNPYLQPNEALLSSLIWESRNQNKR